MTLTADVSPIRRIQKAICNTPRVFRWTICIGSFVSAEPPSDAMLCCTSSQAISDGTMSGCAICAVWLLGDAHCSSVDLRTGNDDCS